MASLADKIPNKDEDVTMGESGGVSTPKELENALYARCASFEEGHVFSQNELFSFGIIPDKNVNQLLAYTKQLAKDGLFKLMTKDGKICWKVVKRADAAKYRSLSQEEALVYSYIEGAAREGIWSRMLRLKTNLHMTTVNHAVKSLENKNLIKAVNNIKHPNRKTYMLAKLEPSEDMTGDVFSTDGKLDDGFIAEIYEWVERYVIGKSWLHPPLPDYTAISSSKVTKEGVEEVPPPSENAMKSSSKMTLKQAEERREAKFRRPDYGRDRNKGMEIILDPRYQYPTLSSITKAINEYGVSKIGLKESDIKKILDILWADMRLDRIKDGKSYRAVKQVHGGNGVRLGNGLTESPCGHCPVFDLCEVGSPVNPDICPYLTEWYKSESRLLDLF